MRKAVMGFVVGSVLVALAAAMLDSAVLAPGNSVFAQHARADSAADGEVITLHWGVDGKHQQLVLIQPQREVMSVYHVDRATGSLALKSVRQFHWDFQLRGFNEVRPYAEEIRAMAAQR